MSPLNTFAATLRHGFGALEPALSREAVRHHFIQHHRNCYERTAALVKGTALESFSLESLVRLAAKKAPCGRLFMLASEAWNHDLYWRSLRPGGVAVRGVPSRKALNAALGASRCSCARRRALHPRSSAAPGYG